MHGMCTHTKKQTWPFLPEICYSKKKHCFCMVLVFIIHYMGDAIYQFYIFKHVVCIIITNERHVCNNSKGTKVSFMLKEIIYGKSPIFSPVIDTFFFGRNINSGTHIAT